MSKKVIGFVLGTAVFAGGMLYASQIGPFSFDDKSGYISGNPVNGRGYVIPSASSTTINAATSDVAGQLVFCNTCTADNFAGGFVLCVSTAANSTSWVVVSSTFAQACK